MANIDYTASESAIYFLNDRNIQNDLDFDRKVGTDLSTFVNPIPSMTLFQEVVDRFSPGRTTIEFLNGQISTFNWIGTVDLDLLVREGFVNYGVLTWNVFPKKIRFGTDVLSVGDNTFRDCQSIEEVWFPERLEGLGTQSFSTEDTITAAIFLDRDLSSALAMAVGTGIGQNAVQTFHDASQEWVRGYVGTGTGEIKEIGRASCRERV